MTIAMHIRSDLGVLSNLIGSLSLADEHFLIPTNGIKLYWTKQNHQREHFPSVYESEILGI